MPEKTDVLLGGTKRFECRVIGYPRPDIKWYKDGVEITSNKRYNFTFTREGVISMLIEKVSRQDEGCYRCRASNSEGMASTAAYLFVRTKKSKFLDDTPSVHSMSFGEASEKDLEHDREYKSKQMMQRKEEFEAMETEEYEHRITMEEQSDILKGRERTDDVISGTLEQKAVTLTEISSLSEGSESSFSSLEQMKGSKDTQEQIEKVAKMYEESQKAKNVSVNIESESVTKVSIKEKEAFKEESEVSIEEKKSKKVEISSKESKEVSMTSSVTKESVKLEEEIRKKEEQLVDLLMQENTKEPEMKGSETSRLDVSVDVDETKTSTQTADDSGLGLSFTADIEERSFTEPDDTLLAKSSVEIESKKSTQMEITSQLKESSNVQEVEEKTQEVSAEVQTGTNENIKEKELNISAETSIDESKDNRLSFDATLTTDSSKAEKTDISFSSDIEEKESLLILQQEREEVIEKKLEETESLHGETVPESLSERVATPQDLVLPKVGLAEYKAEELGEQQSVSSVEDLSSEHFTEPKTGANDYFGEEDLVLPIVRQAPVYKTEELKDQLSEGSVEDLPLDETSQSESDVKVEEEPSFSADAVLETQADILEGPPETSAEMGKMSLGPDSGIFEMSLGSSVDSVERLAGEVVASAKEGQAEEEERMPTFVSFEQRVSESEVRKSVESTETLQESETTFVSKTEEEKSEAKKSQNMYMADGVSEEKTPVDEVQSLGAGDVENMTVDVKVEEGNRQQLIKQPSIEALVDEASLDDITGLADLHTIESENASHAGEGLANVAGVQMADKEHAVESQSDIVTEITRTEDNLSEISEAPQPAEVTQSKQRQDIGSERAQVMPEELILQADANVENTKQKPAGMGDVILADAEVDIEEKHKKDDDTLMLKVDVDVSEHKYDSGESGLKMSATVDTDQVVFTPKVTRVPEDVSVLPGETIHLVSEVQGSPAPEVKWFKEGDTVKPTERISLLADNDIYTLEIREATGSDAGTYTLTAHNSEGTIFSDVQVTVNVPAEEGAVGGAVGGQEVSASAILTAPEFVIKPEDVTVQELDPVKLVCSVKGSPTPEVKWQQEGRTLRADNRMRIFESDGCHYLEIPQASFMDSGEYECIATNSEGTVTVVIRLTVEGLTDIDESGLSTNEELRMAMSERSDTDVSTESATRRYIKLVGAAAAFTLVAFGINKIVQVLPKGN